MISNVWSGVRSGRVPRAAGCRRAMARAALALVVAHLLAPSAGAQHRGRAEDPVSEATVEGLTVTASRASCPNREDPRARALWTALRDRHGGGADTSTIAAYHVSAVSIGPRERVGVVDTTRLARGWTRSVLPGRRMWGRIISNVGYGHEIRGGNLDQAYAAWMYAPLQDHYTTHFVEDLFGDRHTLSLARQAEGEVVLRFCPRERSGRSLRIEGTLTLDQDGALLRATWRYLTPRPREDAGGEVDFGLAATAEALRTGLLFPTTSLYWRRTTGGKYYQRWERYGEWRVTGLHDQPDWGGEGGR